MPENTHINTHALFLQSPDEVQRFTPSLLHLMSALFSAPRYIFVLTSICPVNVCLNNCAHTGLLEDIRCFHQWTTNLMFYRYRASDDQGTCKNTSLLLSQMETSQSLSCQLFVWCWTAKNVWIKCIISCCLLKLWKVSVYLFMCENTYTASNLTEPHWDNSVS